MHTGSLLYERVARCRHRVKETLVRIKVKVDGLARSANSTHILAGHNTTKISLKVTPKWLNYRTKMIWEIGMEFEMKGKLYKRHSDLQRSTQYVHC